jgi:hypothetical protein
MVRRKEMQGQKFGKLTVIKFDHNDKQGCAKFRCICDCEKEVIVRGSSLRCGVTQSCSCRNLEIISRKGVLCPNFKHGHSHKEGQPDSPTHMSRSAMRQRCLDPNADRWPKYGGANPPVKICDRWLDIKHGFENFLADLGERPKGTTLGRFGDIGDYEPGNVAWMTPMQQRQNWRPDRNLGACQKKAA